MNITVIGHITHIARFHPSIFGEHGGICLWLIPISEGTGHTTHLDLTHLPRRQYGSIGAATANGHDWRLNTCSSGLCVKHRTRRLTPDGKRLGQPVAS